MNNFNKRISSVLLMLCITAFGFAQTNEHFSYQPQLPTNNQLIELNYNSSGTPLAGKKKISAVVYQYKDYKWDAVDLAFSGKDNTWKASFQVPENCGLMALKFKSDTLSDNNQDEGYFVQFRDKDRPGAMAPGGYAGWGLARSPKYGLDIPGYMKFKGITDTATFLWMNQEITFNQKARPVLVIPYSIALKNFKKEEAGPKLILAVNYLTRADATEDELLKARFITEKLLGNTKRRDSINEVLHTRFPNGSLARLASYKGITASKDLADIFKASQQFLTVFPTSTNPAFDEENRISYGAVYQNLMLIGSYLNKDDAYLSRYVDSLPYNSLANLYYKVVEIPYSRKDRTTKALYPLSQLLMNRYEYFLANRPSAYSYLSPSEWTDELNTSRASHVLSTHVGLLMAEGKNEEAMKYAQLAQHYLNYKNATVNNACAMLLQKKGDRKQLETVLVKSLYENQSTPEMIEMLKAIYVRKHKSDKGFDAYVESLKNPADQKNARHEAAATMISKPMPEWSMKDMNGKVVNAKDLKGKTVILDFWATWCVPCKASFPGMKIAVEKYKNDPNVVFYFVDTEEQKAGYEDEVRKYIKDNNYPFQVLFDNKEEGAKQSGEVFHRIAKTISVSGIPQKLFVDKNGNVRFISIGYNGSASALEDEISILVELTKAAN